MGLDLYFFSKKPSEEKTEQIAYFRKVNALFNWIDRHVKSVENCRNIVIRKEHIESLQLTLEQLNNSNCDELFPTTDGFFFGSTDYDDWYWSDVQKVKAFVYNTLETFDFSTNQLIFYAWW